MRIPLSWLQDYVTLPEPTALVERLTVSGLEVGSVERFGGASSPLEWEPTKVVVAKVLKIEKHPDADKLKLVTVDYGAAAPKTVITGAQNIAIGESGMKVVLGLQGTRYFYTDKDGKKATFTLEPKPLRGIMNDAMCMSDFELGISEDHDGIIILDDNDPAPGTPIQAVLGETVLEIDVLPNMARCLGMLGVAREVAALTGATAREPDLSFSTAKDSVVGKVQVQIDDAKLCPRYSATIIRNAKIGPAPRWMRTRLRYAGMRPISNIVDITNYVMLEYGQPLHAFDYDVLVKRAAGQSPTIIVRRAKAGEKLVTLDKIEHELSQDHLVIADTAGPIALAGVMGGLETEVTESTQTILLESAAFDPVSIRKTARQFTLFSEASTRFTKGIHPEVVPLAAKRAAQFLAQHAGGEVLAGVVEQYPVPSPPQVIDLNFAEVERVLGFRPLEGEIDRILRALQFGVEDTLWGRKVTVPPNRLDIQAGPADLIEEIARILGYDNLPTRLLPFELPTQSGNDSLAFEQEVQDRLVDLGVSEAITYSLSGEQAELPFVQSEPVRLLNGISPERGILRRTLLPGLLAVANDNLDRVPSVALFELGPVYIAEGSKLPSEPRRLALILAGRASTAAWDDPLGVKPKSYDFYDLKGVLEGLFAHLHLPSASYTSSPEVAYLHPGRAAKVIIAGQTVGHFGELHPKTAMAYKHLKEKAVVVAELDLDLLQSLVPSRFAYKPVSIFPPVTRDMAIVVSDEVPAETVVSELQAGGGELLESVMLFDVYRGESIPAGTKSLAYALTYRVIERQLTDKEVDKVHQKIEGRLKHMLKATIRGREG
ncbi:MAG: phenylalanine--tRNA ligase subunit beta [Fimbriiglobus sp.]